MMSAWSELAGIHWLVIYRWMYVTHLMKSPMGSVVWFNMVSMSRISKNIITFTVSKASSLVRTWCGEGGKERREGRSVKDIHNNTDFFTVVVKLIRNDAKFVECVRTRNLSGLVVRVVAMPNKGV